MSTLVVLLAALLVIAPVVVAMLEYRKYGDLADAMAISVVTMAVIFLTGLFLCFIVSGVYILLGVLE